MISVTNLWHDSARNAFLIIFARGISDFGAFLNMVALSTYVYILSNSVMYVSIFLAARVAGGIFASSIGTLFFRRFIGRWSLIGFDVLRALLLVSFFIVSQSAQIYILPIVAFGIGLGNAMFSIGINTQIPYLIQDSKRVSVNGWLSSVSATAAVLGSLVSGLVVALNGYEAVFALNIITYLLASIIIYPITIVREPNKQSNSSDREWRNLVKVLRGHKMLSLILLITMADTLGSAAHNVGFPIISKLIAPESISSTMGLILAFWAVGKFGGARLISILLKNKNNLSIEKYFMFGVFLMSTGFILLFAQSSTILLVPFAIWAGLGDGVSEVSLLSRVQNESDEVRLPIFSLLTLMQMTGFGIGMLIVAPFFVWWAPTYVVLLFHGIPIGIMFITLYKMRNYLFNGNGDKTVR
ncbi:MFS transporter [Francisella sp. 19X1-34]|uniref:MFS transporter n=1 Tax=Francisella sp. 19X1-34 TaxID=3087177 RepID=UPI002E3742A8|nr:MFS transporter [Francisella sp. 19X1-34]MED7788169.1 MFS transporter [Francisella sp. 19X1-34]